MQGESSGPVENSSRRGRPQTRGPTTDEVGGAVETDGPKLDAAAADGPEPDRSKCVAFSLAILELDEVCDLSHWLPEAYPLALGVN